MTGMKKLVTFQVTVSVEDHGEFDGKCLETAISTGLDMAHEEGVMTSMSDTTTDVLGWEIKRLPDGVQSIAKVTHKDSK